MTEHQGKTRESHRFVRSRRMTAILTESSAKLKLQDEIDSALS